MKSLLTVKQQNEFIASHWKIEVITHKWSARGYGNSRIIDHDGQTLAKATGCGYDRFGTVIGDFIEKTFQNELQKLAKRFCKNRYSGDIKSSKEFYGLFLKPDGSAYVDGGCGYDCMFRILNCIGFELVRIGESERSNNGEVFYQLKPLSDHNRKYIVNNIK